MTMVSIYIIQFVHHDYRHINFSAGAPLNATKIAVMKVSHVEVVRVGPELLFLVHKCCFLAFFNFRKGTEVVKEGI